MNTKGGKILYNRLYEIIYSNISKIIIIIKMFIAHSYQFKIASEALKVCKRL